MIDCWARQSRGQPEAANVIKVAYLCSGACSARGLGGTACLPALMPTLDALHAATALQLDLSS